MSVSHLRVEVHADRLALEYVLQTRTLAEVAELGLDASGDGELSEAELTARWPELRDWIQDRLFLELDGEERPAAFATWRFGGGASELVGPAADVSHWLTLAGALSTTPPDRLAVRSELFFDHGNPDHRLIVSVRGLAGAELGDSITAAARRCDFGGSPFADYLRFGFRHVLDGLDHLAFVLALLFGVAGWRSLLAAITSFTLAHTLTLGLSAWGVLGLAPAVVEPGIAFSVVAVLWLHLAQDRHRARPWLPAFAFGLLHGFGFAGVLGEIGLPPHARSTALLSFNVGVELGQLAFVAPVVAIGFALGRLRPAAQAALRRGAGMAHGAFGLALFGQVACAHWLPATGAWSVLLAISVTAALVAGALGRRRAPDGHALRPMVGAAALVALSFALGRVLAAA